MTPVRIESRPGSMRLYVCGVRVHHGLTGCALAIYGLASGRLRPFATGCALMAHDWADRSQWLDGI